MREELAKNYNPSEFEDRIYSRWCERGYFAPDPDKSKPAFSIVIPPPNVTGQLHMGHALDQTLQDILIRTKRMQGFSTLWIPGTDHAGIATQIKVEESLRVNEGLTRYDLGRERFLDRVWDWKNQYGGRIINQLKKLGSSCDWSRERFTMDEGCSRAVKEVFVNLYNKGLIYRGFRIINWCPNCRTALSDAEVEYTEQAGNFWHIRYPVKDSDEFVTVATTRPETMLGDTAVAVHPEDERYAHLVGKMLVLPLVGREIPVVADEYVERDFGTGCVKITPAHDPNDFEVGKRHDLAVIKVMNDDATINEEFGGKYAGMDRFAARREIVKDLEAGGYLVKIEPCSHNVGTCYRCKTTVEPITSDQWFVKMAPLAAPALEAVRSGDIKFEPERFTKTYTNWMENCHDWCISRQLWWGHRIPAYYCDACGHMEVSKEDVTVCPECGAPTRHEEDVLDTWFSSALWPFSTMGWPDKTEDLERYYPTSVLVTGYDIIFFWVSRMIFSGLEHMGKKPFSTVFIHGLVRDAQGRKMSKSLGNGIDPLKIIEQYGADALRFALATGNAPGNDMRFSDEKIESARNFANKLWNASRFVLMNLTESDEELLKMPSESELAIEDKWIISSFNKLAKRVNENVDNYEIGVALGEIYSFTWDMFCDWYIEMAKSRTFAEGTPEALTAKRVLVYVLTGILKLLHPYMPFITEEIYQALPHTGESIMIESYPTYDESLSYPTEEAEVERIIGCISAIRARRAEMNIAPSKKAKLFVVTKYKNTFVSAGKILEKLASVSELNIVDSYDSDDAVSIATDSGNLYIPLAEVVDFEKERARLTAEYEKNEGEISRIEKKLSNEGFVAKAPAAVVEGERAKLSKYLATREALKDALAKLK
ncbi:MAG: valine--tRNA ligase [Ruminococcaceae bacterium]|nr:valine--tRNA ligase [Oscillospiraceae bacterium]